MNNMNNNRTILSVAQNIIDEKLAKNLARFDDEQARIEKVTTGLKKIFGNSPERVLSNMPNVTWTRGGRRIQQTDEIKIKSLMRAVLYDFKIVKCSRISEKLLNYNGKTIDLSTLKRMPNEILDVIENLVTR